MDRRYGPLDGDGQGDAEVGNSPTQLEQVHDMCTDLLMEDGRRLLGSLGDNGLTITLDGVGQDAPTTQSRVEALASRGGRFWASATDVYVLDVDELELLAEACRTLDDLEALRRAVAEDGVTVDASQGQRRRGRVR